MKKRCIRGMTLIEIMIVIAIIGMLMSTVGVFAFKQWEHAKVRSTREAMAHAQEALALYKVNQNASCPKSLDVLVAEKFLTKPPLDAWGQPLAFTCPGAHDPNGADMVSKGKDGQEGTDDDVKSWEL